jgi:hypothetical protein
MFGAASATVNLAYVTTISLFHPFTKQNSNASEVRNKLAFTRQESIVVKALMIFP